MIEGLKKVLILSGLLNVLLMGMVVYLFMREKPPAPYFELKPAAKQEQATPLASDHSSVQMLRLMRQFPVEQLIAKLNETGLVEDGFKERDLALASLVTFHNFDISRALLGFPQPHDLRTVIYGQLKSGSPAIVTLYPSLNEEQFQAIRKFANSEKWPLTSQGLFYAIRQKQLKSEVPDPSLIDAFYLTPEFLSIEMLFNRSVKGVEKQELLQLLLEGDWKMIALFAEQQRAVQDLSSARRQRLLLDYVERKSRSSAYLLLKTDGPFAAHKLDDLHVMALLRLLPHPTKEAEQFAVTMLTSPRSNAVWKMAARRLYAYAGEQLPESYQHQEALERFAQRNMPADQKELIPKKLAQKKLSVEFPLTKPKKVQVAAKKAVEKKPTTRTHTVVEGDSLWKIARRYKVEIAAIKKANKLQSDFLKPGMVLVIP